MKKVKQISLGDKVFAKVKGYPAWPARVDEDLGTGKRFKVYFYGTGETGLVKAEDLFSYIEHKEQFVKSLKRKDYNDAIEEIEAAIAQDQDGIILEEREEPTSDIEKEEDVKRGLKRKLSVDSTTESKKKSAKTAPKAHKTPEDRIKATDSSAPAEYLSEEDNDLEFQEKSNNNREHKTHDESSSEEDYEEVSKKETSPTKFKVVTPQTLRDIIEEFEQCVKDAEKGNEKPEDDVESQNEILLARLTPTQYIGIKLNQNRPDKFETEIDRLRWKESDARGALELKDKVEIGLTRPEDQTELFETDLDLTPEQVHDAVKNRIMERKRTKLRFLKVEATLVELDAAIKTNLALDKADPKEALKDLDVMMNLNVEPLMLKKHSHVMEMVKRLRRYIGNVKEWKLQGKELEDFKKDAEQIRAKADIVYTKYKSLFKIPEDKTFWEVFNEECEKFKNLTKDMSENQMFILCAEPGSRQAQWDELDDQEEVKFINERTEKKTQDKENSSQVLNEENEVSTENSNLTHTSTDSHG